MWDKKNYGLWVFDVIVIILWILDIFFLVFDVIKDNMRLLIMKWEKLDKIMWCNGFYNKLSLYFLK